MLEVIPLHLASLSAQPFVSSYRENLTQMYYKLHVAYSTGYAHHQNSVACLSAISTHEGI